MELQISPGQGYQSTPPCSQSVSPDLHCPIQQPLAWCGYLHFNSLNLNWIKNLDLQLNQLHFQYCIDIEPLSHQEHLALLCLISSLGTRVPKCPVISFGQSQTAYFPHLNIISSLYIQLMVVSSIKGSFHIIAMLLIPDKNS